MDHRDSELLSSYLQEFIQRHDELNIDMAYVVRRIRSLEYDHNNMGLQISALSASKENLEKQIVELKAARMSRQKCNQAVVAKQLRFLRDAIASAPGIKLYELRQAFGDRWPLDGKGGKDYCYNRIYQLLKTEEIIGEARTGYVINNLRNREMGIKTFDG